MTSMRTHDALAQIQDVLDKLKGYVEEHDTLDDVAELNRKYVPSVLQDEITWVAEMAARLLNVHPAADDIDDVPARPSEAGR